MTNQITITHNERASRWEARFAYNPQLIQAAKGLKFRWDPSARVWWTNDELAAQAFKGGEALDQWNEQQAARVAAANAEREAQRVVQIQSLEASRATDAMIDVAAPSGLAYLGYQRGGIAYAMERDGTLIGDEMGLGKTIQAIGVSNADASVRNVLVVCPAFLKPNWTREWRKWCVKGLKVAYVGKGGWMPEHDYADVVVINYDIVNKYRAQIDARVWDLLISDECHYLKNGKAQRTKAVLGARERGKPPIAGISARRRIFMTGTPICNRPIELWPLVQALDPTDLGRNFFAFAKRYCNAHNNGYGWDFTGSSNLDELQTKLRAKFMVRRLKADVLTELPPKRRQIVPLSSPEIAKVVGREGDTAKRFEQLQAERAELGPAVVDRGQADRAQEQIVRNFGPVANPNEISESLLQQARSRSAPLYDAFRSQPARTSDELQAMMQTPAGQQALANARSIAANEGRDPNALGFDLDAQGNVILRSDPSPETLDLLKRGLDDVVGGYRNPITGQLDLNDQGRAVEGLRQRFVSEVDRLYPNYAEARAAYAGPAGERAALQQGRALSTANPRDIQVTMGRMTPGQQDQFRLGQRVAMSDAVDKVRYSSNTYQNIYGSPLAQQRAATVFGEGPAANMRSAYDAEQRMAQTAYDTLGGSPTAMRAAADEAFDSPMGTAIDMGFAAATGGGGVSELGRKGVNWLKDTYRLGASKKKADQIAPLLFNTNPAETMAIIQALSKKSAARDVYVKRARKVGGLFGASLGSAGGSSLQ